MGDKSIKKDATKKAPLKTAEEKRKEKKAKKGNRDISTN